MQARVIKKELYEASSANNSPITKPERGGKKGP
jgi:hypothetical protein